MRYEWDEAKREANVRKHGLDFADAEEVFAGTTISVEDRRHNYGEQRFVTFGMLGRVVVALAHTEQAGTIRLISMRKATRGERKSYVATISN